MVGERGKMTATTMYETRSIDTLPEFQDRRMKKSFRVSDEAKLVLQSFIVGFGIATLIFAQVVEPLIIK